MGLLLYILSQKIPKGASKKASPFKGECVCICINENQSLEWSDNCYQILLYQ